jgi:hypothetical protein
MIRRFRAENEDTTRARWASGKEFAAASIANELAEVNRPAAPWAGFFYNPPITDTPSRCMLGESCYPTTEQARTGDLRS